MAFSAVQRIGKGTNAASISIGSGDGWATPTSGNLLVVTANSDATVTITGTWSAGPSVVDGNGTYIWYKVSDGTESTITCTPSVSDTIAITACEYSGNTASPFDTSNTSTIAGSAGATTTAVSVTTAAAGDLIVAAACTHTFSSSAPTSPAWTNSFTNQLTANSGGALTTECVTFYAELIAGAAGSYSTSASWTNNASDRQELVIAFKAAATGSFDAQVSVARQQSSVTRVGPVVVTPTIGPPQVIQLPQITVVRGVKQPPGPFPAALTPALLPPQAPQPAPIVVAAQSRIPPTPPVSVSPAQLPATTLLPLAMTVVAQQFRPAAVAPVVVTPPLLPPTAQPASVVVVAQQFRPPVVLPAAYTPTLLPSGAAALPTAPIWVNPSQTQPFLAAVTSVIPPPLPQPPAPITVVAGRPQPFLAATIALAPSPLPTAAAPIVVVTSTWQPRQPQIVVSQPQFPAVAGILPVAPILVAPTFIRFRLAPVLVCAPLAATMALGAPGNQSLTTTGPATALRSGSPTTSLGTSGGTTVLSTSAGAASLGTAADDGSDTTLGGGL